MTDLFGEDLVAPALHAKSPLYGKSQFERAENDAYFTPTWCTHALLNGMAAAGIPLRWPVWEPACGAGWISRALEGVNHEVIASDISDYGYPCIVHCDFLKTPLPTTPRGEEPAAIVTNPPYGDGLSDCFIARALNHMLERGGQVAMLMNAGFYPASERKPYFALPAFAIRLALSKRVQWIGPDSRPLRKASGEKISPRQQHEWLVWDATYTGEAKAMREP